jgi:hypothetical protein
MMITADAAPPKPDPSTLPGYVRPTDAQAIERAKIAVRKNLKDPDSAKFSDIFRKSQTNKDGVPVDLICGRVNAKGGFGGYTGANPFVYFVAENKLNLGDGQRDGADQIIALQRNRNQVRKAGPGCGDAFLRGDEIF